MLQMLSSTGPVVGDLTFHMDYNSHALTSQMGIGKRASALTSVMETIGASTTPTGSGSGLTGMSPTALLTIRISPASPLMGNCIPHLA